MTHFLHLTHTTHKHITNMNEATIHQTYNQNNLTNKLNNNFTEISVILHMTITNQSDSSLEQ